MGRTNGQTDMLTVSRRRSVGRTHGRSVGRSVGSSGVRACVRTVGQTDGTEVTDGRSDGRTHGQMDGQVADVSVVLLSDDLQMSVVCSVFFALRVRPCGAPTVGQRGASSKHADSLEDNKHEGKTQLSSSQKGKPLRRTTKRNLHNLLSGLCPAIRPNQEPPRGSAQFAPNSVTSTS